DDVVLANVAGVPHRHVVAGELDEAGARGDVKGMERRAFDRFGRAHEHLGAAERARLSKAWRERQMRGRQRVAVLRTPSSCPTRVNARTARSMCAGSCAADSWTRMRARPFGTTG